MGTAAGKRTSALVGLTVALFLALLLTTAGGASAERDRGAFLVPTGERTGFGAFEEGPHAAARLRHAFGPPTEEKAGAYSNCRMTWERLGVAVELEAFGSAGDPCSEGVFVSARLTDPRWHTASGVHPGGSRASARRASLLRCHANTYGCAATGYALELHHTDCASGLLAGVIAHPRGRKITALDVYWRSCE